MTLARPLNYEPAQMMPPTPKLELQTANLVDFNIDGISLGDFRKRVKPYAVSNSKC